MSRPRLTVRARLTLLYTGLFAVCGAIVVAVSYTLVAQLPARGQGRNGEQPSAADLTRFAAQCRSEEQSAQASIAAIHGGTATARPRDDGGLSVTVAIPSAAPPAQGTGLQETERTGVPAE